VGGNPRSEFLPRLPLAGGAVSQRQDFVDRKF